MFTSPANPSVIFATTSQTSSNYDARKRLARIEAMNPRLAGSANTPIGSIRVIVIPDDTQPDVASQSLHARLFASQCSGTDAQNLSLIVANMGGGSTMALAAMASKYDLYSMAADLNTFGGGGLGASTARASAFLQALKN